MAVATTRAPQDCDQTEAQRREANDATPTSGRHFRRVAPRNRLSPATSRRRSSCAPHFNGLPLSLARAIPHCTTRCLDISLSKCVTCLSLSLGGSLSACQSLQINKQTERNPAPFRHSLSLFACRQRIKQSERIILINERLFESLPLCLSPLHM